MAKEVLFLVEDADEGGYVARALGYSIFTEADSWEVLGAAFRDSVNPADSSQVPCQPALPFSCIRS